MLAQQAALEAIDLTIIAFYLLLVLLLGVLIHRRATQGLDSFYLAGRNLPWWVLGMAGCSSYIDIGGTMALVGLMWFTGLQSIWITHLFWGWFIIAGYMAFQARWIRRSGLMTFAEWNHARFGKGPDAERARTATALFLIVLMIFNLSFIAVGIGKFAGEFIPNFPAWASTLIVFAVVGVYTALGGFFGVVLTDILQTVLIAVAAVTLGIMAWNAGDPTPLVEAKDAAWSSLWPRWELWSGYAASAPEWFAKFEALGPLLLAVFGWCVVRILAGPNVWEFQFFLTARSSRDAQMAAGLWTFGYTFRWLLAAAFLVLGMHWFANTPAGFDSEQIMPMVLSSLDAGVRGAFLALLLAALMSTLDAMVNVTSAVVVHDLLERTVAREASQRRLVRYGQVASLLALGVGFGLSFYFESITGVWETMIFAVVTVILVPATLRWHWWRFSARAFTYGMVGTAILVLGIVFASGSELVRLPLSVGLSLAWCVLLGFLTKPAPQPALVAFYASVRPFGFWGPIRREAAAQGLVPERDRQPQLDIVNLFVSFALQVSLALVPIYGLLRMGTEMWTALGVVGLLCAVMWWTWRATLPMRGDD